MSWPDCHRLDATPLLPSGWQEPVAQLAAGPDLTGLIAEPDWHFAVVTGNVVTRQLDWLWRLYHGAFRDFAGKAFGRPLYPSNRRDATITLNVLAGTGATNVWHRDANSVTGVLFVTAHPSADGGALQFRDHGEEFPEVLPIPGLFVCFPGTAEHRVAPLQGPLTRLAFAMTFYASPEDQPFASQGERYERPD